LNFFPKLRHEKLYKNCMIEFLLNCSNSFSYTQNEEHTWQCCFPSHWRCLEDFCFGYISTWENDRRLNFFKKDVPSKALQKLYETIHIANQKTFPNIFNMMGSNIVMYVLHFEYKKNHKDRSKGDQSYSCLIEFFTEHLLEKNSSFYHLPNPRYMRNKRCYNIMNTHYWNKKKLSLFFLIDFLRVKLHLMFNVNISKDAARSGLSRYI